MSCGDWFPVLICGFSIPISLIFWICNIMISKIFDFPVISPTRWFFSSLAPLALMIIALKRKSVNKSGATLGLIFAFILSIANHAFFASLAMFFFSSSRATKFRSHLKRKFENDFKEGEGQRNWVQVLCNGGVATVIAVLYLIDCGSGENPIDFVHDYRSSWLCIAVMSSFACCNGDTWASELGSVLSKRDPFLITTHKRVPRGTNGGVSIEGLLVSLLGGLLVGVAYYLTIRYTIEYKMFLASPPQWPIIIFGAAAGLFGSIIDSILGALFQYSGIDVNGKVVEFSGKGIRHISGLQILDNHSVNLISSLFTALTVPFIVVKFWPNY